VVLGRFPQYLEIAKSIGARALQIPAATWEKMSKAQQWIMNQRFPDQAIKAGEEFVLATPPDAAPKGSFYAREIAYLLSRGYQLVEGGTRLIPPAPPGG
jgi:hypothetical protein